MQSPVTVSEFPSMMESSKMPWMDVVSSMLVFDISDDERNGEGVLQDSVIPRNVPFCHDAMASIRFHPRLHEQIGRMQCEKENLEPQLVQSQKQKKHCRVSFSQVHVRRYAVEYNSSVTRVPCPIRLGRTLVDEATYSIDDYGNNKRQDDNNKSLLLPQQEHPRNPLLESQTFDPSSSSQTKPTTGFHAPILSPQSRQERLLSLGYSKSQIRKLEYRRQVELALNDIKRGDMYRHARGQRDVRLLSKLLW